jgi:hypothetical protein
VKISSNCSSAYEPRSSESSDGPRTFLPGEETVKPVGPFLFDGGHVDSGQDTLGRAAEPPGNPIVRRARRPTALPLLTRNGHPPVTPINDDYDDYDGHAMASMA